DDALAARRVVGDETLFLTQQAIPSTLMAESIFDATLAWCFGHGTVPMHRSTKPRPVGRMQILGPPMRRSHLARVVAEDLGDVVTDPLELRLFARIDAKLEQHRSTRSDDASQAPLCSRKLLHLVFEGLVYRAHAIDHRVERFAEDTDFVGPVNVRPLRKVACG